MKQTQAIAFQAQESLLASLLFLVASLCILASSANAQVQSTTTTPASVQASQFEGRLRLLVGAKPEYTVDEESEAQLIGYLAYPLSKSWKLELQQGVVFTDEPDPKLLASDSYVWLKRPEFAKAGPTTFGFIARGIIGTSEASRDKGQKGQGKLYVLSSTALTSSLTAGLALTYAKFFYEETVSSSGKPHSNHQFAVVPSLSFAITKKLSLSATSDINTTTNYDYETSGFLSAVPEVRGKSYKYINNLQLGYQVTEQFSAALGLDTLGPLIEEDGREKPYYFYKTDVSSAYLDVQVKL